MATFFKIRRITNNLTEDYLTVIEIKETLVNLMTAEGWTNPYSNGDTDYMRIVHSEPYGSAGWVAVGFNLTYGLGGLFFRASNFEGNDETDPMFFSALSGTSYPKAPYIFGMVDKWGITLFGRDENQANEHAIDGGRGILSCGIFDRRKFLARNQTGFAVTTSFISGPVSQPTVGIDRDIRPYIWTEKQTCGFSTYGQYVDIIGQDAGQWSLERAQIQDAGPDWLQLDYVPVSFPAGAWIGLSLNSFVMNENRTDNSGTQYTLKHHLVYDGFGDLSLFDDFYGQAYSRQQLSEWDEFNLGGEGSPLRTTMFPTHLYDDFTLSNMVVGFHPHVWNVAPQRSPAGPSNFLLNPEDRVHLNGDHFVSPHGAIIRGAGSASMWGFYDDGWSWAMGPGAPRIVTEI